MGGMCLIPYSCDLDDLIRQLGTDSEKGLSSARAGQLLQEHGENRLREGKKKTNLQKFLDQFKDVMILIPSCRRSHFFPL